MAAEATTPPAAPPTAPPPPGTGGVPPAGNKLKRAEPRVCWWSSSNKPHIQAVSSSAAGFVLTALAWRRWCHPQKPRHWLHGHCLCRSQARSCSLLFRLYHKACCFLARAHSRTTLHFVDAMAASGPAPEVINCRLAMLAFVTCAAVEVNGGGPVLSQATAAGPAVAALFGLTTLASLIPICAGLHGKRQGPGPFTLDAELLNGRLAAVAFAAQIVLELQFQNTLF